MRCSHPCARVLVTVAPERGLLYRFAGRVSTGSPNVCRRLQLRSFSQFLDDRLSLMLAGAEAAEAGAGHLEGGLPLADDRLADAVPQVAPLPLAVGASDDLQARVLLRG